MISLHLDNEGFGVGSADVQGSVKLTLAIAPPLVDEAIVVFTILTVILVILSPSSRQEVTQTLKETTHCFSNRLMPSIIILGFHGQSAARDQVRPPVRRGSCHRPAPTPVARRLCRPGAHQPVRPTCLHADRV